MCIFTDLCLLNMSASTCVHSWREGGKRLFISFKMPSATPKNNLSRQKEKMWRTMLWTTCTGRNWNLPGHQSGSTIADFMCVNTSTVWGRPLFLVHSLYHGDLNRTFCSVILRSRWVLVIDLKNGNIMSSCLD